MTHDDLEPPFDSVPPGRGDIDALLDGEPVDKEALRSALADADARDYLLDALLLRQLTRDMGPAHFVAPGRPRGVTARRVRWLAAAAVLTTGTLGGYVYGQRSQPAPDQSLEVAIDTRVAPVAPEPTRVIRFEPGVNWSRTNGSH